VVECIGLENRQRGNPFAGSNPAPSADEHVRLVGEAAQLVARYTQIDNA
jgi:hypothetical protein